jgi:leucyl/phenylalanyl-tRNA--protein transferase
MQPDELQVVVEGVPFPDPNEADEHGLLAYGGDLGPERLLSAYARGIFPWYEEDPILWFSPDPRMVLLPDELRVNRSLAKSLRRNRFEVRVDTAFEEVIDRCAAVPRPGQNGTWITRELRAGFVRLHELGFAHSVESWLGGEQGGELVGGIYGMSLGAAFFGESMFATQGSASKVAFVALVRQLQAWHFDFLDCQVHTDNTEALGAREWPRRQFLKALARTLEAPTRRGRWTFDPLSG